MGIAAAVSASKRISKAAAQRRLREYADEQWTVAITDYVARISGSTAEVANRDVLPITPGARIFLWKLIAGEIRASARRNGKVSPSDEKTIAHAAATHHRVFLQVDAHKAAANRRMSESDYRKHIAEKRRADIEGLAADIGVSEQVVRKRYADALRWIRKSKS